jgi:hypothetical protein
MRVIYSNFRIEQKKPEPIKAIEPLEATSCDFSRFQNKTVKRPFNANALGDSIAWSSFIVRMYQQLQSATINDLRDKDKMVLQEVFGFDPSKIHISTKDHIKISKMECYNVKFAPAKLQWKENNSRDRKSVV